MTLRDRLKQLLNPEGRTKPRSTAWDQVIGIAVGAAIVVWLRWIGYL